MRILRSRLIGLVLLGLAVALAVLGLGQGGAKPAAAQPTEPHYQCYISSKDPDWVPPVVSLETQFGFEYDVEVLAGEQVCNPAIKTRAGGDPEGTLDAPHLRWFPIDEPAPDPPPIVNLTDQFGSWQGVEVGAPVALLAPAFKTIVPIPLPSGDPPLDPHYKCYQLPYLAPVYELVTVVDQFFPDEGTQEYVSASPMLLCVPAGKKGAPIPDAPDLVCHYAGPAISEKHVNVKTQFAEEHDVIVGLTAGAHLCVPAIKTIAVGGIAELPDVAGASAGEAGASAGGSGWSAGSYAALAGGLAAAAVVLSASWWYARRRFSRN